VTIIVTVRGVNMPERDTAFYCGKPVREYTGHLPLAIDPMTGVVSVDRKYPTREPSAAEAIRKIPTDRAEFK
jgi:hypothetical protein